MPDQDNSGATPTDPTSLTPGTLAVDIADPPRKQVPVKDVIARGAVLDAQIASQEAQQAEIHASLATDYADRDVVDKAISDAVAGDPDGYYLTAPDGTLVVYTRSKSDRGYTAAYPSPGDTLVDDPFAKPAGG